jgi:predicted TIM-barrel fold metal-dependent hydrolase
LQGREVLMLIDINAHVGHWPFKQLKYNTSFALLDRMNKFGTEVSVVSNLNGVFYTDTQSANEELSEELRSNKKFANRLIPFAVLNPIYAGWKNDLEICISKFGMKGVCLYPLYHDYEITDPDCIELIKRARDKGLIVTFTHRIVDARQRSWMDISTEWTMKDIMPVIREVKDAKYFIVNAANSLNVEGADNELLKNTDLLIDTSGRSLTDLGEMLRKLGREKFAFGTHTPVLDYLTGLLRIESLRENEADAATKELLRSGNAKRMLGI